MTLKDHNFDLLSAVENNQTPLFMSLIGFRKTLSQHLGITSMPMIMHSNVKAILRREQGPEFPYGYFKLTSFEIDKDKQAVKTLRRHGSTITLDQITNAMVSKGYLFPTKLTVEVHFVHNDVREVLKFVEKLTILGAVDAFSFTVNMPGATDWTVGVEMDSGPVSIPDVEFESDDPNSFDITINFTLNTKAGVIKAVPKVNNEGNVTTSYRVPGNDNVK